MSVFSPVGAEHTSLGQEVARLLRKAIIEGRMAPGERIVEAVIAEQMGVSRGPVRDAIMELERQGLVVSSPRRSTVVAEVSRRDLEEIYTLRSVLEGLAARLAAQRITPEEHQQLQETIDTLDAGCDVEQSIVLDLRFHDLIGLAGGHARLREALSSMHIQTELLIRTQRRAEVYLGAGRLGADHQSIVDSIVAGDGVGAEQKMRMHIEESGLRLIAQMPPAPGAEQPSPSQATIVETETQSVVPNA